MNNFVASNGIIQRIIVSNISVATCSVAVWITVTYRAEWTTFYQVFMSEMLHEVQYNPILDFWLTSDRHSKLTLDLKNQFTDLFLMSKPHQLRPRHRQNQRVSKLRPDRDIPGARPKVNVCKCVGFFSIQVYVLKKLIFRIPILIIKKEKTSKNASKSKKLRTIIAAL